MRKHARERSGLVFSTLTVIFSAEDIVSLPRGRFNKNDGVCYGNSPGVPEHSYFKAPWDEVHLVRYGGANQKFAAMTRRRDSFTIDLESELAAMTDKLRSPPTESSSTVFLTGSRISLEFGYYVTLLQIGCSTEYSLTRP